MNDRPGRVTAAAAYELCELYAAWFPGAVQQALTERLPKCEVEFVL